MNESGAEARYEEPSSGKPKQGPLSSSRRQRAQGPVRLSVVIEEVMVQLAAGRINSPGGLGER